MKNTYPYWQQRLLCPLLAACLGAASCTEAPLPCSLVVMDAHGHPPESGHVFLAMPNSLSDSSTVLGWTVVSDTLHWDPLTGMVIPNATPPAGSHWRIHSPNPIDAMGWRHLSIPVLGADSCVLPMDMPWEVHLRAHRSIGHDIEGYDVHFSSAIDADTPLAATSVGHGSIHLHGTLRTHDFPVLMSLSRRFAHDNETHLLAQTAFEYVPANPTLSCHWEDGNADAP